MTTIISSPIPTNIITGFLGSGKTTLIQYLLSQKPADERWAILVNEFGEIGIDGSLFREPQQQQPQDKQKDASTQQVFIREVPGGCMCCTSGLPMQIALNQLITKAKPHRLIIEPTGLGHPKEVLAELSAEHNREYLDLKAVITLIDARKLVQPKYHSHQIYKEQLQVADLIVANKSDLYAAEDIKAMEDTLQELDLSERPLELTSLGKLDLALLEHPAGTYSNLPHLHSHGHKEETPLWQSQLLEQGFTSVKNAKDDFRTEGWIFNSDYIFEFAAIFDFLSAVEAERVKGVFITEKGIFGFNKADDVLSYSELDESDDSRVEFIFAARIDMDERSGSDMDNKSESEPDININAILMDAVKTKIA